MYVENNNIMYVIIILCLIGFYDKSTVREMMKECSKMSKFDHPNVLTLKGFVLMEDPLHTLLCLSWQMAAFLPTSIKRETHWLLSKKIMMRYTLYIQ